MVGLREVRAAHRAFLSPSHGTKNLNECNGELVLKNSVRRRVFPQGSFFPFVLFFFGSLFLYAVAIAGCALLLRKRTSRFRFCATAAR